MLHRLLIFITCAAVMPGLARSQEHENLATAVFAFEDARFAAMITADTAALAPMLADDLVYIHSTGAAEGKTAFLKAIGSRTLRYLSFTPEDRRVIMLDSCSAIVVGRISGTVAVTGREVALDARYTAVYHRATDGWKLKTWQSTRIAR